MRLHRAPGYVTPNDKLEGREMEIFSLRNQKLEEAREIHRQSRHKYFDTENPQVLD